MNQPESSLGVLIDVENRYGTDYVRVRAMRRLPENSHPLNITYGSLEDHGECADLVMDGFISDIDQGFIGPEVCFEPHQVKCQRAVAMARVLRKIQRVMQTQHASDPGDVFTAFCKGIGAKWACHYANAEAHIRRSSLAENEFRWMTIPEGREHFRWLIAQAKAQAKERAA